MTNDVVLITGCSSGIGYETALKFARSGHKTFASVRNAKSDGAKKLKQIQQIENIYLEILQIDVTDVDSIKAGIKIIKKKSGRIDVLVNNAGFGYLGPIESFSIKEVEDQYNTNIYGILRMVKEVAPIMRAQRKGTIVNMSSISGIIPFPLFSVYSSSKYAVEAISEGLSFELSHFGIRVIIIEPGSFLTNFTRNKKHPREFGDPKSPYKPLIQYFFDRYNKTHDKERSDFVSKVLEPKAVVDTIYKAVNSENPRLRYLVGNDAHIYFILRKILPQRVWNWLLHKVYKW